MAALPTLLLAYNWQFNLFPVFKGMQNPTDKKMFYCMITGYSMASFLYLSVGILGYATYGDAVIIYVI
jgi:amino acid permease